MGRLFPSLTNKKKTRIAADIDDVVDYIKASTVAVSSGTKCVDGRYLPTQSRGMLARPGADCGYVMALEAVNRKNNLGLTPEQCFNEVFKAVKALNHTFYLHTDDHTDPNPHTHNGLIGCGHLAKAGRKLLSWEYDVRSNDVKEIVNYARNLCEVGSNIEMINLTGKHQEKGVLIIHSDKNTVNADNPKLSEMYFIYDVDRDRAFLKKLVAKMNITGVTYQDMIYEADLQLEATLQNLAIGLPIYDVTFKGSKPQVTYVKHIEQKPLFSRMHVPFALPLALTLRK